MSTNKTKKNNTNSNNIQGYLGIDIGSISTKAVVVDVKNKILASEYL
jgi:activator of 2-hydroxyglutaryl-CoA dehydratase